MSQSTFVKGIETELSHGISQDEASQMSANYEYWLGVHGDRIKVAYVRMFGGSTPLYLQLDPLYGYHGGIFGKTRSGKTTGIKTVLYLTEKKKYKAKMRLIDTDNQFSEFDKYDRVTRYNLVGMSWAERFKLMIRYCERIMERDEGEGEKEVLVIDEAQNYIPEYNLSAQGLSPKEIKLRSACRESLITFLQQCLKRNVNLILISPTVPRICKQAIDTIDNFFIYKHNKTKHVENLVEKIPQRILNSVTSFDKGDCIVSGPMIGGRGALICRFRQIEKLKTYSMVGA